MNLLERAAEVLEEEGWVQGAYHRSKDLAAWMTECVSSRPVSSGYCMLGAIAHAAGLEPEQALWPEVPSEVDDAVGALMSACRERHGIWDIPSVNDTVIKDKYEAIDMLKVAGKRLEVGNE